MRAAAMQHSFDPCDDFRAVLIDAGLDPGEVIADGHIHRCPTAERPQSKNGWFVLFPDPPAGAYGDWQTGLSETWSNGGDPLSPADRARLSEAIERQKAERAKEQAAATEKARACLATLPPATDANGYLSKKGVKACPGLLADGANLVVPILAPDDNRPMSYQRITPDGSKRFASEAPTRGGFFAIKGNGGPLMIAEGIATGLSIRQATGATVLVAFSANNLEAVGKMARTRYPERTIIMAADNDTETEARTGKNPGIEAATLAAKAVGGLLAIPERGGDWNDLHQAQGLEAVKAGIEAAKPAGIEQPVKPSLVALDLGAFLGLSIPPRDYVLTPIIPTQGLVMIHAPRGIGKTLLALFIAYVIATGQQVCRWIAPNPRPVLYLDGEMPAVSMQERLAAIVNSYPVEPAPGFLRIITPDLQDRGFNLATTEGQALIEPHLDGVNLVIVDNLATLCRAGRENETESWRPVQDWILGLRRRGLSVAMVHHSGKSGGQRGTSAREDILDTVIALRRPADYTVDQGARFEVHLEKARGIFGEDARPFEAMLTTGANGAWVWVCRDIEDMEADNVARLNAEGLTVREIAQELGLSKSKVHRLLKKGGA